MKKSWIFLGVFVGSVLLTLLLFKGFNSGYNKVNNVISGMTDGETILDNIIDGVESPDEGDLDIDIGDDIESEESTEVTTDNKRLENDDVEIIDDSALYESGDSGEIIVPDNEIILKDEVENEVAPAPSVVLEVKEDRQITLNYQIYSQHAGRATITGSTKQVVKESELNRDWKPNFPGVQVNAGFTLGEWCYLATVDGETKIYSIGPTEFNRIRKEINNNTEELTYNILVNPKKYASTVMIFHSANNIEMYLAPQVGDTSSNADKLNATNGTMTYTTQTNNVYIPTLTHYNDNIPYCWVDVATGKVVYDYETGWTKGRQMTYEDANGNKVYEWKLVAVKPTANPSIINFSAGDGGQLTSKDGRLVANTSLIKEISNYGDIEFPEVVPDSDKEFIGWVNVADGTVLEGQSIDTIKLDSNGTYNFVAKYTNK